jgi:hypothetical protein
MTELGTFFQRSHTALAHPHHHVVAMFPSLEIAQQTARKLRTAGIHEDDVVAAAGAEVVALAREETGIGTLLMQALSRFLATEQKYVDGDLEQARHGAGFLAVHCPTERVKQEVWKIVGAESPLDARYYATGGIEHLAGDLKTD